MKKALIFVVLVELAKIQLKEGGYTICPRNPEYFKPLLGDLERDASLVVTDREDITDAYEKLGIKVITPPEDVEIQEDADLDPDKLKDADLDPDKLKENGEGTGEGAKDPVDLSKEGDTALEYSLEGLTKAQMVSVLDKCGITDAMATEKVPELQARFTPLDPAVVIAAIAEVTA